MITPLHSSLGDRVKPYLKKNRFVLWEVNRIGSKREATICILPQGAREEQRMRPEVVGCGTSWEGWP